MKILVAGITGSIGSALAPRLVAAGHEVSGLTRSSRAELPAGLVPDSVALTQGDVVSGDGLDAALRGVEVAYFLVHSMEASAGPLGFEDRELQGAQNFAARAARAGVRRIVFLGGMLPLGAPPSPHLASRLRVEQTLLAAVPDSLALRASIVIGESSRSFRLLVRLVERMPVLPLPGWQNLRTAPIDQRDVIDCLTLAATAGRGQATPLSANSFDLAGPDIVSYGELIEKISDALLINRPIVGFQLPAVGSLTSIFAALIAGEDPGLVTPLMQSLEADILPQQPDGAAALGQRLHSLDSAIEHAIGAWDEQEPLRAR